MTEEKQRQARVASIPGFPDYFASRDGNIYSSKAKGRSWIKLKPQVNKDGYLFVTIWDSSNRRRNVFVHRLVLAAFSGGDRPFQPVDHKNGIRHDNRLENLQWVKDQAENNALARKRRGGGWGPRGEACHSAKLTAAQVLKIRALHAQGVKGAEIARRFGITPQQVSLIILRKRWGHI